jgi:hypothetical protein
MCHVVAGKGEARIEYLQFADFNLQGVLSLSFRRSGIGHKQSHKISNVEFVIALIPVKVEIGIFESEGFNVEIIAAKIILFEVKVDTAGFEQSVFVIIFYVDVLKLDIQEKPYVYFFYGYLCVVVLGKIF